MGIKNPAPATHSGDQLTDSTTTSVATTVVERDVTPWATIGPGDNASWNVVFPLDREAAVSLKVRSPHRDTHGGDSRRTGLGRRTCVHGVLLLSGRGTRMHCSTVKVKTDARTTITL